MDPALINDASFSAAYRLAEMVVGGGGCGLGLRMGSLGGNGLGESSGNRDEESTLTEQSAAGVGEGKKRMKDLSCSEDDESSKMPKDLSGKRMKLEGPGSESGKSKAEIETSLEAGGGDKRDEQRREEREGGERGRR